MRWELGLSVLQKRPEITRVELVASTRNNELLGLLVPLHLEAPCHKEE